MTRKTSHDKVYGLEDLSRHEIGPALRAIANEYSRKGIKVKVVEYVSK